MTEQATLKKTSIWSVPFVALLVVNFLRMMGQSICNTALPLYAYDLGAAASVVGFVSGAFAISALLVRPFAGPAFDSFSKTRMFLIFGILLAISGFAYAFVTSIEAIIVVRLIHGVGMGCTAPLGLALACEVLPLEKMSSGISIYSLAQTAALALGPAFAVWMVSALGYVTTFVTMGIFLSACCIVVALFVREKPHERPAYKLSLNRAFAKQAVALTVVIFLMTIPFSCINSFLVLYGQMLGIEQIALYFTLNALCMLVTRPIFGRLADTIGDTKVIIPTIICFAASFVLLAYANSLAGILIAAVLSACGYGASAPLLQAAVLKCVPHSQQGSASNTIFTGTDLGFLVGPYLGGCTVEVALPYAGSEPAAYAIMWLVLLIPIFAGLIAFIALRGKVRSYEESARKANETA